MKYDREIDAIISTRHVFFINAGVLHSIGLTTYARQSCGVNNFADLQNVRIKICKISFSCWWRFLTATTGIKDAN